ncbi:MAG: PBS lyase, partial [Chloroflexota bacterium]
LLRNVAVALGNWGAPQAIPALIQALHDPEPLIRGHAAWALGQMDDQRARAALAAALKVETDEMVIAEIRGVLNSQGD